jgi:hypothetical protein
VDLPDHRRRVFILTCSSSPSCFHIVPDFPAG